MSGSGPAEGNSVWRTGGQPADDTGGGIGMKHIDVLVKTHNEALSQTLLRSGVWLLVKK